MVSVAIANHMTIDALAGVDLCSSRFYQPCEYIGSAAMAAGCQGFPKKSVTGVATLQIKGGETSTLDKCLYMRAADVSSSQNATATISSSTVPFKGVAAAFASSDPLQHKTSG